MKDLVERPLPPHLNNFWKVLFVGIILNGGGTVSPSSK